MKGREMKENIFRENREEGDERRERDMKGQ